MVVSAEHFDTGIAATIRRFTMPLGIFLVIVLVYVWFLSAVLH